MNIKKSYDINQLRDYSSLFSRSEVTRWHKNDFGSLKMKISRYDASLFNSQNSYLCYLKYAYQVLQKFYPNEYIYKNEFINKWLVKELGVSDSVVFNEFRLGKAVADMVMFNGNSKVFEIKTLLDKDSRLSNQLVEYCKIFNEVYVIVPETKVEKYLNLADNIGVITYSESNAVFVLYRLAIKNEFIDANTIMQILHTNEYTKIVEEYHGYKPLYNDFNKFEICKKLIMEIPHRKLNDLFINQMKARKIKNEFCKKEKQLNQIFLSLNLSSKDKHTLLTNLRSTISC